MSTGRDGDGSIVVSRAAPERAALTDRFGGFDLPASLIGVLVAVALQLILASAIAAIVGTNFDLADLSTDLAVGTMVAAVAVLFVAYYVGGWAAARIARYDGVLNGIMVAVLGLLLAAAFAGLGAWAGEEWNVFAQIGAPSWMFDMFEAVQTEAIIAGIGALLAMLLGGALGGWVGQRYHRKADATLASVRDGGLGTRRSTTHDNNNVVRAGGIGHDREQHTTRDTQVRSGGLTRDGSGERVDHVD